MILDFNQIDLYEGKYLLTIYCITYNHEKYITNALESFVKQKTDFPFRVIVHDDASTDLTAKIIREYEKKYPDIIFAIFEEENQHSKGIRIHKIVGQFVTEKYCAICEGDDFWIDDNKLQIQVDYLENNPDCTLCVHNTKYVNIDGSDVGRLFSKKETDCDYSAREIIDKFGGDLFQTSSFVMRREYLFNRPENLKFFTVGDYPMAVNCALNGRVHYIARVMSCYRIGNNDSWGGAIWKTAEKRDEFLLKRIGEYESLNEFTDYKYNELIRRKILYCQYVLKLDNNEIFDIFRNKRYRDFFVKEYNLINRVKMIIKSIFKNR